MEYEWNILQVYDRRPTDWAMSGVLTCPCPMLSKTVNANLVGVRRETASRALLLFRPARLQAESGQPGCQLSSGGQWGGCSSWQTVAHGLKRSLQ